MNFTKLIDPDQLGESGEIDLTKYERFVCVFVLSEEDAGLIRRTVGLRLEAANSLCTIVTPRQLDLCPPESPLKQLELAIRAHALTQREHSFVGWVSRKTLWGEESKGGYVELNLGLHPSDSKQVVKEKIDEVLKATESEGDLLTKLKPWLALLGPAAAVVFKGYWEKGS